MTTGWSPDPDRRVLQPGDVPICGLVLSMWGGEYEGVCLLDDLHEGDHFDGATWFSDGQDTSEQHADDLAHGGAVAFAVAFHNARREEARKLSFRTRCADELGVKRPPLFPAWSSLSEEDMRISIRAARALLAVYPGVSLPETPADRRVVKCNHRLGTSVVAPGASGYVVLTNPGNGHDRIQVLFRSRGGRWVLGWHATDRLDNFRVKTLPPEHPMHGDQRILDADAARALLDAVGRGAS